MFYCARYRETKVQALMCAQSAPITRICAQSVSFADTISACPLWPLPLHALASLARGGSRALKGHITKDTIKIFKSLKSPKYSIILLYLLKIKSVWNYFFERLLRIFEEKKHTFIGCREISRVSTIHLYHTLYCAHYRETKVSLMNPSFICARFARARW